MSASLRTAQAVAVEFENAARLLRERPEEVFAAVDKLRGLAPGFPDPVSLPQEQRHAFVRDLAHGLGISTDLLMLLYGHLASGLNAE